ncbi:MAG: Modular polyketide synthase, partial [uncultured bacterium]
LKCLLSIKNKKITPSKYLTKFIGAKSDPTYINTETIDLKNSSSLRFGISSFGFGNANFHVVLDEFNEDVKISDNLKKENEMDIAVIAKSVISPEEIDFDLIVSKFKIPFKSLSHIDKVQLQALLAVDKVFEKANIDVSFLDKENVSVISASSLGLDSALDLMRRVRHFEFIDALNFLDHDSLDMMIKHKEKFIEITEDTGPGVLNNVIAGRICNAFDFNGENFNIDSDFNSASVALSVAMQKLNKKEGIVVLVHCDEKLSEDGSLIERKTVGCSLLSTIEFAKANNYPICEIIEKINFYDSK